jgi:hypothetical protein
MKVARVPKLNKVFGGSTPGREIVSLLDKKLAKWSKNTSCDPNKK